VQSVVWSDQVRCQVEIAGLNAGIPGVHARGRADSRFSWYYADDKLLAVGAMNDPRALWSSKRLMKRRSDGSGFSEWRDPILKSLA